MVAPRSNNNSYEVPYCISDFSENRAIMQTPLRKPKATTSSTREPKLQASKIYQPPGGRMSYFEQGLILGLAMIVVAASGITYVCFTGVRSRLR